jgi:hypothetical protein
MEFLFGIVSFLNLFHVKKAPVKIQEPDKQL